MKFISYKEWVKTKDDDTIVYFDGVDEITNLSTLTIMPYGVLVPDDNLRVEIQQRYPFLNVQIGSKASILDVEEHQQEATPPYDICSYVNTRSIDDVYRLYSKLSFLNWIIICEDDHSFLIFERYSRNKKTLLKRLNGEFDTDQSKSKIILEFIGYNRIPPVRVGVALCQNTVLFAIPDHNFFDGMRNVSYWDDLLKSSTCIYHERCRAEEVILSTLANIDNIKKYICKSREYYRKFLGPTNVLKNFPLERVQTEIFDKESQILDALTVRINRGFPRLKQKLESSDPIINLGFIGSCLALHSRGWRPAVVEELSRLFPNKQFRSTLFASSELWTLPILACQEEVFLKNKPDLVFIEELYQVDCIDNILRNFVKNDIDVFIISRVKKNPDSLTLIDFDNLKSYDNEIRRTGLTYIHYSMADHYGIPMVNLSIPVGYLKHGDRLISKTKDLPENYKNEENKILFSDDGEHLLPQGLDMYKNIICNSILSILKETDISNTYFIDDRIVNDFSGTKLKYYSREYEGIKFFPWQRMRNLGDQHASCLPEKVFTVEFTGTYIGYVIFQTVQFEYLDVEIDGEKFSCDARFIEKREEVRVPENKNIVRWFGQVIKNNMENKTHTMQIKGLYSLVGFFTDGTAIYKNV